MVHSMRNSIAGRRAIYRTLRGWALAWLWMNGMPVKVLGEKPAKGRYIIVANHISYLDTVVLFPALPGYFRPLGKKEFAKIPVMGFVYRQITILVNRSSAESRTKSMRLMWRVLRHEADILIFPEGTFNETGEQLKDFFNGAFRLAITTQTPVLPVIFPDTVHRWHYSHWWKIWPGKNRAVYLEPISAAGMTMDRLDELKQRVADAMAKELARYDYP